MFVVVLLPMDNIFCMYFLISYEYCWKQTSYGNRQSIIKWKLFFLWQRIIIEAFAFDFVFWPWEFTTDDCCFLYGWLLLHVLTLVGNTCTCSLIVVLCWCVAQFFYFSGRLDEAYSHCVAVLKTKAFKDSLEWVACCVEIFEVGACFGLKSVLFLLLSTVSSDMLLIVLSHFIL